MFKPLTQAEFIALKREAEFGRNVMLAIQIGRGNPHLTMSLIHEALSKLYASLTLDVIQEKSRS